MILNDLIEEDFTSRTYDNVKAFHVIVISPIFVKVALGKKADRVDKQSRA